MISDHSAPLLRAPPENPVNDCGRLWLAPLHHLTLSEVDVIPGGEVSVEINVIGIQSSGIFLPAKTLALFTLFKPLDKTFIKMLMLEISIQQSGPPRL